MSDAVEGVPIAYVARDVLRLSLATLAANLLTFATTVLLGRTWPPERFGQFVFLMAFGRLFEAIADGGLSLLVTRQIAQCRSSASTLVPVLGLLKLGLAMGMMAVLGVVVGAGGVAAPLQGAAVLVGVMVAADSLHGFLGAVANGLERLDVVAALRVGQRLLSFGAAALALGWGADLTGVVAWMACASLLGVLVGWWWVATRLLPVRWTGEAFDQLGQRVRQAWPFALLFAASLVYGYVDIPLLHALTDSATVARYGTALYVVTALMFIPANLSAALYPRFAKMDLRDRSDATSRLRRALRLAAGVAVPAVAGLTLLAHPAMRLIWGERYLSSAPILQVLAWRFGLECLTTVLFHYLVAVGQQLQVVGVLLLAIVVKVGLDLAWIPHWQAGGVALAAVLAHLTLGALLVWLIRKSTERLP